VGGVEQSRLLTPDCQAPRLEVTTFATNAAGALEVELLASMGREATALEVPKLVLDGQPQTIVFDKATGRLRFETTGLAMGKHTAKVTVQDVSSRQAEPVLLPFWIEAEPLPQRRPHQRQAHPKRERHRQLPGR
jgi:hypothetical protein